LPHGARRIGQESEQLNDNAAFELHDLRPVFKPFKRGFLGVVFLSTGTVVVRGFKRGGIFRPEATLADSVSRGIITGG